MTIEPTYAPLVAACRAFGISRTLAFRLVNEGLLDTFQMKEKGRRFVNLESLRTLPDRISKK